MRFEKKTFIMNGVEAFEDLSQTVERSAETGFHGEQLCEQSEFLETCLKKKCGLLGLFWGCKTRVFECYVPSLVKLL